MTWLRSITLVSVFLLGNQAFAQEKKDAKVPETISYYKDVRRSEERRVGKECRL